jgi:hypothetical protein
VFSKRLSFHSVFLSTPFPSLTFPFGFYFSLLSVIHVGFVSFSYVPSPFSSISVDRMFLLPMLVALQSEAKICGRSFAVVAGPDPADDMVIRLLFLLYVV